MAKTKKESNIPKFSRPMSVKRLEAVIKGQKKSVKIAKKTA